MHEIENLIRETPWLKAAYLEDPMVRQMCQVADHEEVRPVDLLGMITQRALAERDELRKQLLVFARNVPAPFVFKGQYNKIS